MSKIDVEVSDELNFEIGDCCIVIKSNGSIGRVILPEMAVGTQHSKGYKKMLKVIDFLKPGAKRDFVQYNKRKLH